MLFILTELSYSRIAIWNCFGGYSEIIFETALSTIAKVKSDLNFWEWISWNGIQDIIIQAFFFTQTHILVCFIMLLFMLETIFYCYHLDLFYWP